MLSGTTKCFFIHEEPPSGSNIHFDMYEKEFITDIAHEQYNMVIQPQRNHPFFHLLDK